MAQVPKGIGVHVFAGGFTEGVRKVLPVAGQLEIHNFGRHSVEARGLPFLNADRWEAWDEYRDTWGDCQFSYGNPRCTSFSCYSSGRGTEVRGAFAKPTQDIWDLCRFSVRAGFELIAFESVQQAYSVGHALLVRLRDELFAPNHYRVAHLFVNTAAEGNAQHRRRYFHVAYKDARNFNVCLPLLPRHRVTVGDVLKPLSGRDVRPITKEELRHGGYPEDAYYTFSERDMKVIPYLLQGESFGSMARRREEVLERLSKYHHDRWLFRESDHPFSLHCPRRLHFDKHCPTIASTARNYVHPTEPRGFTVKELSALMGWEGVPSGPEPASQLGKGVVPATGAWLAQQIKLYFEDAWGDEDFESSYDHHNDALAGSTFQRPARPLEKTFNLTYYLPPWRNSNE